VKITGTVRNVGKGAFASNPGQQAVYLYEGDKIVASKNFTNLASNATLTVSFTRKWSSGTEFPPMYKLVILYDPDIYLDGNPANDDANSSNNQIQRSGQGLNDLLL
jgi:hypothetical protein